MHRCQPMATTASSSTPPGWCRRLRRPSPSCAEIDSINWPLVNEAFSKADSGSRADVLLAIRGFATYRSLILSLERSGVRHASVYATAAGGRNRSGLSTSATGCWR